MQTKAMGFDIQSLCYDNAKCDSNYESDEQQGHAPVHGVLLALGLSVASIPLTGHF